MTTRTIIKRGNSCCLVFCQSGLILALMKWHLAFNEVCSALDKQTKYIFHLLNECCVCYRAFFVWLQTNSSSLDENFNNRTETNLFGKFGIILDESFLFGLEGSHTCSDLITKKKKIKKQTESGPYSISIKASCPHCRMNFYSQG